MRNNLSKENLHVHCFHTFIHIEEEKGRNCVESFSPCEVREGNSRKGRNCSRMFTKNKNLSKAHIYIRLLHSGCIKLIREHPSKSTVATWNYLFNIIKLLLGRLVYTSDKNTLNAHISIHTRHILLPPRCHPFNV